MIEDIIHKHNEVVKKYDRDLYNAMFEAGLTPEQLKQKQEDDALKGFPIFQRVVKTLSKVKVKKEDCYQKINLFIDKPMLKDNSDIQFSIYHDGRVYCYIDRIRIDRGAQICRNGGDWDITQREFLLKPLLIELFSLPNIEELIYEALSKAEWLKIADYALLENEIKKDQEKERAILLPKIVRLVNESDWESPNGYCEMLLIDAPKKKWWQFWK